MHLDSISKLIRCLVWVCEIVTFKRLVVNRERVLHEHGLDVLPTHSLPCGVLFIAFKVSKNFRKYGDVFQLEDLDFKNVLELVEVCDLIFSLLLDLLVIQSSDQVIVNLHLVWSIKGLVLILHALLELWRLVHQLLLDSFVHILI